MTFAYFFVYSLLALFGFRETKSAEVYKIPLKLDDKTNLYWSLDYPEESVRFEVHAFLRGPSWLAIGFSDYGNVTSADFCILWADWKKNYRFQDAWTAEDGRISTVEKQDCSDFFYAELKDEIKFTFSRKFDTCDPHDYKLEDGTTHVVWAVGEGPLYSLNGVNIYSARSKGFERTQLLKNEYPKENHPADTWNLEIRVNRIRIPSAETTYWCRIQELPDALNKKHHIIQYEPILDKGSERLVHHMEVFHCIAEANETIPYYEGPCFHEKRPKRTQVCKRVISAWATGARAFSYPQDVGLPIGGSDYNRFVMLEVHYNNPELLSGLIDSSGIRLYLTSTPRKYDGGVMELGLEYTDKMVIPPGESEFRLSGYCTAECTAVGLPYEGIVIFASQLHTHLLGVQIYTKHVRKGKELREINRDNHFSSHFQEIRRLKHPVRVLPGDALITTCAYNSNSRNNITLGGFSITDEMCVNYIHYYPRTNLEVCKSSISNENLFNYFDYLKKYENQDTDPTKGISENYGAIEWNPMRVEVLNDLYETARISMQCNHSSGERFPGQWEGLRPTKISEPLHFLPPTCAI